MKFFLKIILVLNVIIISLLNVTYFSKDSNQIAEKSLNKFGKKIYSTELNLKPHPFINSIISIYCSYLGANRCYEYFSPNVSKKRCSFSFRSDTNQNIELLSDNYETRIKKITFEYLFSTLLAKNKIRDKILISISNNIFKRYPKIKKIEFECKIGESKIRIATLHRK